MNLFRFKKTIRTDHKFNEHALLLVALALACFWLPPTTQGQPRKDQPHVLTKSRIAIVLIALFALVLPAVALASDNLDPMQWGNNVPGPSSQLPNASTPYRLWNYSHGVLGYGKQTFGVNLVWREKGSWEFMCTNVRDHRRLVSDERVALYNTAAKAYLIYRLQNFGINLSWSNSLSDEWKIARSTANGMLSLYNTNEGDYLVYGERPFGINLRWLKDLKASQTPTPTTTSTTYTLTIYLNAQPPVSGYIPFYAHFDPNARGNVTSVSNPLNNATLLFVKRGYSSNDCGNSNAVIALGPTATMTGDQKRAIWALPTGVSNPPLPTDFLACLVSSQSLSSVPINITYRVDAARVQPSRPSRSPRSLPSP